MKAGIIAAGWGERLGQKIPKALTPVNGRVLIDYVLDGLETAGATEVTCIVNEEARVVPEYVDQSGRRLKMDWIIQTTPTSMHSFLMVLERLAQTPQPIYPMATVDGICAPSVYAEFYRGALLFKDANVVLGLTDHVDDENPLRVAMRGRESTGLMPERLEEDRDAYEIVALTNNGFDSEYITSGFYAVTASILKVKDQALAQHFTALRQYLGYLLKYGYRFYGVPLPPVIDVDRPQDIKAAEEFLNGLQTQ